MTLPKSVRVSEGMTLTPNEMRELKAATGRSLSDLLGGDAEDMDKAPDRIQSLVWIALRREGHDCTWDEAGDVQPDSSPVPLDPTKPANSNSSPLSVATGG
jgi:hypothetical protein